MGEQHLKCRLLVLVQPPERFVADGCCRMRATYTLEPLGNQGFSHAPTQEIEPLDLAGLNSGILATGWYRLRQMLACKSRVADVDPAYSSQTCHACGIVAKASRKGRKYKCVACGHAEHAGLNAARNIMASGIGACARRGAFALASPLTREIVTVAV